MQNIFLLALSALLLSCTSAQTDEGTESTTHWITPTVSLPTPFGSPSIYLTADSAGACEASLQVYYSNSCRAQTTVYPATTTLNFPLDCLGCSNLASSVRFGHCPLGGHHSSYADTTMTTPHTVWKFVGSPTPPPTGPVSVA